jgi:ABC-2 type transport system permease protein
VTGVFTPDPRPAPALLMLRAQTGFELRLLVRNGEQLLLALVIPVAALLGLTLTTVVSLPEPRTASALAGVATLAILSAAFTSLAIATAFDRRYGVTKRLLGAGVPRRLLLAGKITSTAAVVGAQLTVLAVMAAFVGWQPAAQWAWVLVSVLLGLLAFTGLGLLLGGTVKAELVLALANLIWLVFLVIGGVVAPLSSAPSWLAAVGRLTPAGALSDALHASLTGHAPPWLALMVLVGWVLVGWVATLRWFRWQ